MTELPIIVVVMGLPGSGKTYFAKRLAEALNARHISSDQVRMQNQVRGKYRPADKQRVYQWMLTEAASCLQAGQLVVLDATFHRQVYRQMVEDFALAQSASLSFIEIVANEETIRQRLSRPRLDSEANFAVYQKLKQQAEPLPHPSLLLNSSEQSIDAMLQLVQEHLSL